MKFDKIRSVYDFLYNAVLFIYHNNRITATVNRRLTSDKHKVALHKKRIHTVTDNTEKNERFVTANVIFIDRFVICDIRFGKAAQTCRNSADYRNIYIVRCIGYFNIIRHILSTEKVFGGSIKTLCKLYKRVAFYIFYCPFFVFLDCRFLHTDFCSKLLLG